MHVSFAIFKFECFKASKLNNKWSIDYSDVSVYCFKKSQNGNVIYMLSQKYLDNL